ncbi:endonuclease/exonuclease/phosphatase family protein [Sphingobacterium suaedae]|uniref:Endonuclease/exonuclease/phosphatase family protein n=1 Tax=Sphingobacterium suaedae TaxID=1686402 RepID=A0ABW5KJ11_9SPHI
MNTTLLIVGIVLMSFTVLPLIRQDYWTFRVFDYPRIQKLVLALTWLATFMTLGNFNDFPNNTLAVLMFLNCIYLFCLIYPFTILGSKQVKKIAQQDLSNNLRILISNVYEDNINSAGCLSVIKRADADVVLLLETNDRWAYELQAVDDLYPFHIKIPLNNTYGMLFFSKFPLTQAEVRYLVEKDIPSIRCRLELPSGQPVQIYAVHPTPPVPNENPRSTERDKELLIIADEAKQSNLPVVVIGDLNDVAWSYTTTLFLKMSGLLDPRRGRGFFNTFHAHYPFLRFPLDHAFTSPHFKLVTLRKEDNFDSDHFPIFVHLQFEEQAEDEQEEAVLQPDKDDHEIAEEKKQADTE